MNLYRNSFNTILTILFFLSTSIPIYSSGKILKYDRGIIVVNDSSKVKIELITPTIIHIISTIGEFTNRKSLIIEEIKNPIPIWTLEEHENEVIIKTDSLIVKVSQLNSGIGFYKQNDLIVQEIGRKFVPSLSVKEIAISIKQTFRISSSEALYGLGQHQNGVYNFRNKSVELVQDNSEVAIPFVVSTNNYGILWDNYSKTIFSDNSEGMSFHSEVADKIEYYFIYGQNIDKIVSQYRNLTGQAPLYPKWAYGFFQSRNRYWTQKELLNTVEKFRKRFIPLDAIVLDYLHWGKYGFGSFQFDESFFPDPKQMIDSLHNIFNCKLMVSVWPSFSKDTPNWLKMNSQGYLLDVKSYENTIVYDAYNPIAGRLYWELIYESYGKLGVDGWWLDATEPERMSEYRNSTNFLGSSERYLNTYSLVDVRNVYEGQRKSALNKRVFTLTRSSFAGQQKYAASTWSGDIGTSFKTLKTQIPAGLNFCVSGIPYWTTDIGGYKGGDPDDPLYRELYIRWFQYGTFCPIFRSHGRRAPGDRKTPNEIWSYGIEAENILTKYLNLRYRLLPYIYSEAWKITNKGSTMMRGLFFDFPQDTNVFNIEDQFMFGNSLLINPVVESKRSNREVYLPAGTKWFDFWTGQIYEGGKTVIAEAPIDKLPIFVKAGSIITMGPFLQYSTEKLLDPIEIRLYAGANAEYELFEDENDSYNYEEGVYSIIKLIWNDKDSTLTLSERKGEYPGMMKDRTFHVVIVGANHGTGIEIEYNIDKKVYYTGNELVTRF